MTRFFGGVSGRGDGAWSAFLARPGLERTATVDTAVVSAVLIDVAVLPVCVRHLPVRPGSGCPDLMIVAARAAFSEAIEGSRRVTRASCGSPGRIAVIRLIVTALGIGFSALWPCSICKEDHTMKLVCLSFGDGASIPLVHAHGKVRGGRNLSPGFRWEDPPVSTKSFALSIIDAHPVARNWVHWLLVNIPFRTRELPEGCSRSAALPAGIREMMNTYGERGYGGPAPPAGGGEHPYVATLYALNVEAIMLGEDMPLSRFLREIEGKVADEAGVKGMFER